MTIQIRLSAESEARLLARAAAEGRDPAEIAQQAVEEKLREGIGAHQGASNEARSTSWRKFVENMREWTAQLPSGHVVDDSRDGIYAGRGE